MVPVLRALLLALALLLAACPAWAGIVPSYGGAQVTLFQQGILPDSSFAGHAMVQIQHRTSGGMVGDSANFGAVEVPVIGAQIGRTNRVLESWTFGSYLPSSAIIDSMKECYYSGGTGVADSLLRSLLLVPWVVGSGDGVMSADVDTLGASWAAANNVVGGPRTAWNKRGADSSFTATGNVTWHTAREQSLLGKLTYGGAQDKEGAWHYSGSFPATAAVWDTTDVSFARFVYNDVRAGANYGWVSRAANEGTGRLSLQGPLTSGGSMNTRPMLIVYWHDTRQVIQIGGGE